MRLIGGVIWAVVVTGLASAGLGILAFVVAQIVRSGSDPSIPAAMAGLCLVPAWLIYRRWAGLFLGARR
jgi:hypothetical protein